MTTRAFVEHRVPGRVRLRIPSKRGDISFFESVVQKLSAHPSVGELSGNPHTGNLVIHHSGSADDILSHALDLFELGELGEAEELSRAVAIQSGLPMPDILDGTAAVLAGCGAYQFARGGPLGTASENFLAAFGSYRILKSPGLAFAFAGLGLVQLIRGELLGSAAHLLFNALLAHHMAELAREEARSIRSEGEL
jgi:hypothetical protein